MAHIRCSCSFLVNMSNCLYHHLSPQAFSLYSALCQGGCKVVYHWINSNAHPFTQSEVSWGFRPKKAPVVTQFSHNQRAWKQTYLRFNRQHSQPFNSWVLHCSCQACKSEIVALCYLDAMSNCRKKLVHLKREGSKTSVSLMCDDFV